MSRNGKTTYAVVLALGFAGFSAWSLVAGDRQSALANLVISQVWAVGALLL